MREEGGQDDVQGNGMARLVRFGSSGDAVNFHLFHSRKKSDLWTRPLVLTCTQAASRRGKCASSWLRRTAAVHASFVPFRARNAFIGTEILQRKKPGTTSRELGVLFGLQKKAWKKALKAEAEHLQ